MRRQGLHERTVQRWVKLAEWGLKMVAWEDWWNIPNKPESLPLTAAELREIRAVHGSFTDEEYEAHVQQFVQAGEILTTPKLIDIAIERGNVYLLAESLEEDRKNMTITSIEAKDKERKLVELLDD